MNFSRIIAPVPLLRAGLALLITFAILFLLLGRKPWQIEELDKIQDYGAYFSWWAAAVNLLPLTVLFLTINRWAVPLELSVVAPLHIPRNCVFAILGAMLVFAVLGGSRLGTSLWDDEEYAVRRAILGTYKVKDDGTVRFRQVPWSHTFWYYTKPTNHVFQSVLARLSLSSWRAIVRPKGLQINEPAVRFPSYLGGILAVGTVGLLLGRAGFPREGVVASWLLALHPWFLRLAPEARGYGLVFLFILLACLMALRAAETGGWRWWLGLAASEFALLYTWPPALMVLLVLNACLVLRILAENRLHAVRGVLLNRWLVSGTVAAMAFFQLFLPCLPQFRNYIKLDHPFTALAYWLKNVGSLLFTGCSWSKTGSLFPPYPETWPQAAEHPVFFGTAAGLAVVLILFGAVRLWRKGNGGRTLVAVFLVPGPVMFVLAAVKHTYLYEWYLAFMLPGLAALAGMGLIGAFAWTRKPWIPWATAAAALAIFIGITSQARRHLLRGPAQPLRESVLLTRPSLDPTDPRNLSIITVSSLVSPDVYDPLVRRVTSLESYQALMEEADRRGVPLYANNGFPLALRFKHPAVHALLSDPEIFEPVAHLYAVEEMLDRSVVRYRPGSVVKANWNAYRAAAPVEKPASVPLYY
jgi:hypothetical protein